MARNRIMMLPLETRLQICDRLIDGASYEQIRASLQELNLPESELPSDESIKNYQAGDEYQESHRDRVREYRRQHWRRDPASDAVNWVERARTEAFAEIAFRRREDEVTMADLLQLLRFITRHQSTQLGEARLAFQQEVYRDQKADKRQKDIEARQLGLKPPLPPPRVVEQLLGETPAAARMGERPAPAAPAPRPDTAPPAGVKPGKTDQNPVKPRNPVHAQGTAPAADLTEVERRLIAPLFGGDDALDAALASVAATAGAAS